MQASSDRTWQVRLALMVIVGVAAAAACVVTLMWLKAPVAPAQEEGPTGESFVVKCGFSHDKNKSIRSSLLVLLVLTLMAPRSPRLPTCTTSSAILLPTPTPPIIPCGQGAPLASKLEDKAAYWIPTVSWTDSSGTTVRDATQTFFYYKLGGKAINTTVNPQPALPPQLRGLKIVTLQGKNVEWRCANGTWSTTPPRQCSNGKLVVRIKFPDCLAVNSSGQPLLDSRRPPLAYGRLRQAEKQRG